MSKLLRLMIRVQACSQPRRAKFQRSWSNETRGRRKKKYLLQTNWKYLWMYKQLIPGYITSWNFLKSRTLARHSIINLMELVGHHVALPLGWQQRLVDEWDHLNKYKVTYLTSTQSIWMILTMFKQLTPPPEIVPLTRLSSSSSPLLLWNFRTSKRLNFCWG